MTSVSKTASVAVALLIAGGVLAACAPEPSPDPSSPPPTAEQTPMPTPTTTTDPAPEPTPAFTTDELAQICIDATTSLYDSDVEFDAAGARVEERTVTPEWLVLVPAQTNGYDAESACTIGGSPADPVVELTSTSIEPLSEDQIQDLIRGVNQGEAD